MPPTNKKPKTLLKSLIATTSATLGCGGCGSRHRKLPDVHHPLPKPQPQPPPSTDPSSSTTTHDGDGVCNSIHDHSSDLDPESDPLPSRDPTHGYANPICSSKLGETFAVVKDSNDPYLDFKHSMLQMIFEKEIFQRRDLQELLACFLRLNAPCHHDVIIRAFSEIWKAVMSPENQVDSMAAIRCSMKTLKD